MRGKERCKVADAPKVRITPAYAGKSVRAVWKRKFMPDHPRLCGEKVSVLSKTGLSLGSPPPMRGKVPAAPSLPAAPGITPAYAGKSHAPKHLQAMQ